MDSAHLKNLIDLEIIRLENENQATSSDAAARGTSELRRHTAISVVHKGEYLWGAVVALNSSSGVSFDHENQQTLDGIASQLSLAVLQRDLVTRMEYQASHDELTGLPNRRLFKQRIQSLSEPESQTHSAAEVMLIDLDGFKIVNDQLRSSGW